jgi:uncharacterized protein YdeI (YjbR/CyaY-like superfamily)
MATAVEIERVEVHSRADLRLWLSKNHSQKQSIWLITFKRPDQRHLPYDEVVEEALCFGWVDSLPRALDEKRSMLRLSPRQPRSAWSKLNKERVEKLTAQGLMQPSGLAVVDAAKASGLWSQLDEVETLTMPDDLSAALKKNKLAAGYFDLFPRSVKRAILEWILNAKKPETRAARIIETVSKAEKNIRANQWRQ